MGFIYLLLALVWSILCLILFFKVWGMTNDVRIIKDLLSSQSISAPVNYNTVNERVTENKKENENKEVSDEALYQKTLSRNIKEGDFVFEIKTGKRLHVQSILPNGDIICYTNKTLGFVKQFSANDIATLDEYNKR